MPKFRTQFDAYDKRIRPKLECLDPSRTDQSQAQDVDINYILERFRVTGQPPAMAVRAPTFDDFTVISDFTSARAAILDAQNAFMALPGDLRAKLDNDPQQFLLYIQDDKNRDDLVKRGFILPAKQSGAPAPTPSPAPAGAPTPAAPPAA